MAYETNFQPSKEVNLVFGTEATLGTATVAGGTWNQYPVTDFSLTHPSVPLEVAATKSGKLVRGDWQAVHRPDTASYSVDVTFKGTTTTIIMLMAALFESTSSAYKLQGTYNPPNWKHGGSFTTPKTLLFENAGSDNTNMDLLLTSCVCTSMTLSQDGGTESGQLVASTTWWTGYQPTETALTPDAYTIDVGQPKSIFDLDEPTLDSEVLQVMSWSITAARSVERVSYKDVSTFVPYGYAMSGDWEVTGELVVKRDDSITDLASPMKGGAAVSLTIAESTAANFSITCGTVKIDNSKPEVGESFLTQTIPFQAFYNSDTAADAGDLFSLTIAN